jgi:murein L,D-transpeptidase YafK
MRLGRILLVLSVLLALGACSKFKTYNGPEVTRVVIYKGDRTMHLLHHGEVLQSHEIDLGFAPRGHKQFEGDGRTPEGRYYIDRRNPDSSFHLSIGISYPNERDIEVAREAGRSPGGDIFIHGRSNKRFEKRPPDWTAGCIAVSNREMEWIYAMVRDGTVVDIYP